MRIFSSWLTNSAICLLTAIPTLAFADANWPTFRGADRSGVSPDKGLLSSWPEGGPKLLYEAVGAGRGYAAVAIADGKMYTLGDGLSTAKDADEYLVCFDLKTGKQLWAARTGSPWNEGKPDWQSSRSTPTIDGDRVYALTAKGVLICFDIKSGESFKEIWRKDLTQEFSGKKADSWGYSESVTIDGDRLICTPGNDKATMVALNKMTGDTVWTCAREGDRGAGHASVVISEIGGTKVYVQTTGSGAMGVRAKDGKLLWKYDIDKTTAVIPTPIVRGDLVFFTAGYDRGGALLKQVAKGDDITVEEVYPLNRDLQNKHGGVVLVGDYLYGDRGDGGRPFCADLKTGEIKWNSRGSGSGSASVTAADGHLYVRYTNGMMTLVELQPKEFKEVGSFKIPGSGERPSWAHPVVNDGKLYLREGDKILCYSLRP